MRYGGKNFHSKGVDAVDLLLELCNLIGTDRFRMYTAQNHQRICQDYLQGLLWLLSWVRSVEFVNSDVR